MLYYTDIRGETIGLVLRLEKYDLCIDQKVGKNSVRHVLRVGDRHPLWVGASGKAILANNELAEIKKTGYAITIGECTTVTAAIAAPIFERNKVMGSILITEPLPRFDRNLAMKYSASLVRAAKK